jgi:uncharacterized integral membrane protein
MRWVLVVVLLVVLVVLFIMRGQKKTDVKK